MENLLNPMNIFGIIFMKIMANDGRTLLLYLSFLCTSVALIFEFSLYYIDNQKYMSLFFF